MPWPAWLVTAVLVVDVAIKVVALGVVPRNRRPGSSQAWLLLILLVPLVGLALFLLIGSPYLHGRRNQIQADANRVLLERGGHRPVLPPGLELPDGIDGAIGLNRALAALPCVTGTPIGLYPGYEDSIAAMTDAVRGARRDVWFAIYILALDDTTEPFFAAMAEAVRRGVVVRLLYDHWGSRKYPGFEEMNRRLTDDGVIWHQMLPIKPLQGKWRRPDLRNHRKILVVDGEVAFMGSQNMIDASYLAPSNIRVGRRWHDLNIGLRGPIVHELAIVFAIDWFTETGERLELGDPASLPEGDRAMQVVPSGPGFTTEPNLRLFNTLIYRARRRLTIVSPYFVPDESVLMAITTAAQRGVEVELFASAKADQLMVHHAQRSYYQALLDAGVTIWLYPEPAILHTKCLTIDDEVAVIGSSNMDMRSFYLDYEVSLMVLGPDLVHELQQVAAGYREVSERVDPQAWPDRPLGSRYVDNVMRLTSALQ